MSDLQASTTTAVDVTSEIARYLSALRYDDIPAASVEGAKRFMLDTLAVAWAGSSAPGCAEARQALQVENGSGSSTIWGRGERMPVTSTAFVNGMYAAALDFDSLGRDSPSHVNVVILPATLAMAEHKHVSGKAFLTALVAGCDLMCRLGAASEITGIRHRGWFYTSVHGVLAAAGASASILGLDRKKTQHALALAYSQAGGTQQIIVEPGLAKRMGSGFAARAGVFAALLAEQGLSGPRSVIEGQYGLFLMYQPGDATRLLRDLGRSFENTNLSIKKFPSCGCNHAALEAALQLSAAIRLAHEDIEEVEVEISEFMNRLVGGEFEPGDDPQAAAQFNIRYSIACALVRGRFGLSELEPTVITDPVIQSLGRRIKVVVDPNNNGKRGPAVLKIRSRRHGLLTRCVEHVPGSEESPLPLDAIAAKSRDCLTLGARPLDAAAADSLIERVLNVEHVADMATLFDGIL